MKRILLIIISSLLYLQGFSQTEMELQNEVKYWIWRDRLVNDFMVPGNSPGCGIIMKNRGSHLSGFGHNGYGPQDYLGGFHCGDEGFEMGLYLAVLATEWYIMLNTGMTTERKRTELELFYELSTIDRLDISAEEYWNETWLNGNGTVPSEPNGFMIRDDVFEDFICNDPATLGNDAYQHFLYLNQGDNGTTGKYIKQSILPRRVGDGSYMSLIEYNTVLEEHPEWNIGGFSGGSAGYRDHPPVTGPREYSQDNYIGLMVGLCTIIRLMPPNVEVTNPDNCTETMLIKEHAIEILDRIIKFMWLSYDNYNKDDDPFSFYCENPTLFRCWLITNPITGMCVKGVHWKDYFNDYFDASLPSCRPYCNPGGAEAMAFSCGFKRIFDKYCSGSVQSCYSCLLVNSPDDCMRAILATLSSRDETNTNHVVKNWLNTYTDDKKRIDLYYLDLLFCTLWSSTDGFEKPEPFHPTSYYETILSMFRCGTEWELNDSYDYNTSNLLPQMLLHNLIKIQNGNPHYYVPEFNTTITTNSNYPFLKDKSDMYLGSDGYWHIDYSILGSNTQIPDDGYGFTIFKYYSSPTIWSNDKLESSSIINSYYYFYDYGISHYFSGNVQYIAGNRISLKPGFRVQPGAYFNAKIDENLFCGVREGTMDFLIPCNNTLKNFNHLSQQEEKVQEVNNSPNFTILPNPSYDYCKVVPISSNQEEFTFSASLNSIIGAKIDGISSENNIIWFDLSNIPKGIYTVRVNCKGKDSYLKLIKQ